MHIFVFLDPVSIQSYLCWAAHHCITDYYVLWYFPITKGQKIEIHNIMLDHIVMELHCIQIGDWNDILTDEL